MGTFERESIDILGPAFSLLCNAAAEDKIDQQKMRDIASQLHMKVGEKHQQRNGSGESEMRAVISDWYQFELYDLTRENALQKLQAVLEHSSVELKPLAKEIKQSISKTQENIIPADDTHKTAEKVGFYNP